MKRTTLGVVGIGIVAVLVILVMVLPASGAGKNWQDDETQNRFYGPEYQQGTDQPGHHGGNGTCIMADCPHNGIQPRDGTGMKYGHGNSGRDGGQGYGHRFRK